MKKKDILWKHPADGLTRLNPIMRHPCHMPNWDGPLCEVGSDGYTKHTCGDRIEITEAPDQKTQVAEEEEEF